MAHPRLLSRRLAAFFLSTLVAAVCAQSTAAPAAGRTDTLLAQATQLTIEMPCGQPGAINECIRVPKCAQGEALVQGRCVPPTISCIAPSVLQDGRCVRPASAGGGTAAGEPTGSGRDARSCIVIAMAPQKGGLEPRQSITNNCNEVIGLVFCHGPSAKPGTKGTECGNNGRYYQQFSTMQPGQTKENQYSLPVDAQIRFGACFGGEGKIRQTTDGSYNCRQ